MAQATDQIKVYALLIKNHVNLNGNQSQEVIDFYNKLNLKDDNTIKEFDKFIRNNDNQTKLGCEVVKASKGKGKYLRVNMQVFKIFLSNNNIPLDGGVDDDEAIDGATSDVEAIDGAAPDDDLGPAQKRCRRESQTIYSESYIQKQYYKEIFPNIKLIQEQLINLFDIFENDHLKKNVMEFTFKRFIKDFGCFDNLAIIEIYPKVMQGLNQFFNLIKEKYPGTIPTEVNKVNCLLKCDAGRNLETKQLQDEDSSYVLTFFGKDGGKNRLLSVENWKKLKGDNIIVVGLDLNNGDIQLAIMVSRPEKATAEQEFKVSNYTTTLLKDTYYFPIQLLVKVDIKRSNYVPNCYLSMPQILKAPLHCIVPPYLNQGEVRYANNGKEKMNFTNYIKCKTQVITSSSGAMNCIVIDNSDLRYLKSNAR